RLAHIRNDRLKRLPRARRHAGKRHGRTHQLEEAAPRDRIQPFRRTFRKFAVHHFLEFRAACEFFESAPEFRAVLLLDFCRRGSKVDLVLFAGANFLALGLAVLWIAIHFFGRPYGTRSFASPDPAPKCCLKLGRPIGARSLFEIYTQIQNSEPKNTETSVLPVTRI